MIEKFINEKITQVSSYIQAVISHSLHYTELDQFIVNTMEEWTLLKVTNETPDNARERVFWHVIHEMSLYGANHLKNSLYFKTEIKTCLDFFSGVGSYPVDCVGWRPIP